MSNSRFGQNILTNNYDPDLLKGWGVRPSDWSVSVSVQQQILPRASVEVAYTRRWFSGFTVNDNLLVQPADYTSFSITAPLDPRLARWRRLRGLRSVRRRADAVWPDQQPGHRLDELRRLVSVFQRRRRHDERAHAGMALKFQGGTSTGQTVADNCDVRANLPELNAGLGAGLAGSNVSLTSPYCHVALRLAHAVQGAGHLHDPEDRCAGQRRDPEQGRAAACSELRGAGGADRPVARPAAARVNVTNVTVNLVEPGTMYGNRVNQLDFRVAKMLTLRQHADDGRSRSVQRAELRARS